MRDVSRITAIGLAVMWSIGFATAMHDWVLGVCMGVGFAIPFGLLGSAEEDSGKDRVQQNQKQR